MILVNAATPSISNNPESKSPSKNQTYPFSSVYGVLIALVYWLILFHFFLYSNSLVFIFFYLITSENDSSCLATCLPKSKKKSRLHAFGSSLALSTHHPQQTTIFVLASSLALDFPFPKSGWRWGFHLSIDTTQKKCYH